MVLEDSMIFRVCTFRGFKTAIHAGHPTPGSNSRGLPSMSVSWASVLNFRKNTKHCMLAVKLPFSRGFPMVKNCNCMSRFSEDLIKCEIGKHRLHGCTNPLQSIKAENGLVLGGILQALPYLLSSQIIRHHDSCHTGPKRPTRTIT